MGLAVGLADADGQEPVAVTHAQVGAPVHRRGRGGRCGGGAGDPRPGAVEQGLLRIGLDIGELDAQPRRDSAAGGDVDHLVDLDHADGEALVADRCRVPRPEVVPTPGLALHRGLGRDGQQFQEAHPRLTLLHQQDGGGHRHGPGRPGALDGLAPDGLGVDVVTHRRRIARQRGNIADGDILGAGRRPDELPLGVMLGDLEGPQGGEAADPRLKGRALAIGHQVVVTQGGEIRVVRQGVAGEALELGVVEVRGGLDEMAQ